VIPKTLSVNAAQDATELVAALRAEHYKAQADPLAHPRLHFAGLDLVDGVIRDNLAYGVVRTQATTAGNSSSRKQQQQQQQQQQQRV
jgi:hypothetical protein